jgi:uncharacterized protein YbjT (DUF2867 family)
MFKDARIADFLHVDQIIEAISGARAIHYIPPVLCEDEILFAANAIEAARVVGIDRITFHSVLQSATPSMPHHFRKSEVELLLRESPLVWTIFQAGMYMQTPFVFYDREAATFAAPFRLDRPFNPIDMPDMIEAQANVLIEEGHEFATYELAGSERLTAGDMGEIFRTTVGGAIKLGQVPTEDFARDRAKRRGFDERQASELLAMYRHYNDFGLPGNGRVLEMLLGRRAGSFAAAVQREFGTGEAITPAAAQEAA